MRCMHHVMTCQMTLIYSKALVNNNIDLFFNVLSFVISDLSAMIGGAIGQNLNVKNYKEEEVPKILKDFFDSLWHLSLGLMKARNFCGF